MAHTGSSEALAFDYSVAGPYQFAPAGGATVFGPSALVKADPAPLNRSIIALVGLTFEARIASGPGVVVICRNSERALAA